MWQNGHSNNKEGVTAEGRDTVDEKLKKQQEFLIKFGYWAVFGTMTFLLVKFVGPVLLPFLVGALVAWLLCKPVDFLTEKVHLKRKLAAFLVVVFFYAGIAWLLYLAGTRLSGLVQKIFDELTEFLSGTLFPMLENFFGWLERIGGAHTQRNVGVETEIVSAESLEKAGKMLSGISGKAIDGVSNLAAGIPRILMKIVLAVIMTMFVELEFCDIRTFLRKQIPEKWRMAVKEARSSCMSTLGNCILSYGMILALTFVELTVGFLILGIDGAFVIAFVIAVLDILPVLGTGSVLLPWGIIACTTGNLKMGTGILILYAVITAVRNVVEPKLVGKQMGLSPVVMLPCMIAGLRFFGIIGMLGLPFAVAVLNSLNERDIIHLWKK